MSTIRIKESDVKAIFESATAGDEALIAIYKLVFPDWDRIASLKGWPTVNTATSSAICKMFMDFDEKHTTIDHGVRSHMLGGIWLNNGFSVVGGETLNNWEVRPCEYTLAEVA